MYYIGKFILILVIAFTIMYGSKKSIKREKTQSERQIAKHMNSYIYDVATANQNHSNRYMTEVEQKYCPMSDFKQCTNNYLVTDEGRSNLEKGECVFGTDPLLILP